MKYLTLKLIKCVDSNRYSLVELPSKKDKISNFNLIKIKVEGRDVLY